MMCLYAPSHPHVVRGYVISGNNVSKDRIDASIGLVFSLRLLQRYRSNGVLQAKIHHVPGVRGHCMAYVQLAQGVVATCYIEDERGQRQQVSVDLLCRVDTDRGPFEWTFQPLTIAQASPAPEAQSANSVTPGAELPDSLVLKVIAPLPWERLGNWTVGQKQMLYSVWRMIDGRRTVQEIKAGVSLPPQVVNEALQILLSFHIADISS